MKKKGRRSSYLSQERVKSASRKEVLWLTVEKSGQRFWVFDSVAMAARTFNVFEIFSYGQLDHSSPAIGCLRYACFLHIVD